MGIKGHGGVPPPGGQAYHRDDGNMWGRRGVVISPGGDGTGSHGTKLHDELHQEAACAHSRKGGMINHLKTRRQGGAEAGVEPEDEMLVPG